MSGASFTIVRLLTGLPSRVFEVLVHWVATLPALILPIPKAVVAARGRGLFDWFAMSNSLPFPAVDVPAADVGSTLAITSIHPVLLLLLWRRNFLGFFWYRLGFHELFLLYRSLLHHPNQPPKELIRASKDGFRMVMQSLAK